MHDRADITALLNAAHAGDARAAEQAYAFVYTELKRRAQASLRRNAPGATLGSTALVHEVYLRLSQQPGRGVRSRMHFFALAARAMRQILVDHARRRLSAKRGGGHAHTDLDSALAFGNDARTLDVDAALRALEARDADLARLVELHFFAGLSFLEIAQSSDRHERTVRREWELARAFLQRQLDTAST